MPISTRATGSCCSDSVLTIPRKRIEDLKSELDRPSTDRAEPSTSANHISEDTTATSKNVFTWCHMGEIGGPGLVIEGCTKPIRV
jgi:hypothetical protein